MVAAGELFWHHFQGIGIGHHLGEVYAFLADGVRKDIAHHCFGNKAQTHELAAERKIALLLFDQRDA